jgi:nucleoside-diphosphate-sugar epimerase
VRIALTGSSGFIGSRLAARLGPAVSRISLGGADWREAIGHAQLADSVVIHVAGRAHSRGSDGEFARDNVEKTRVLAQAAARACARRFVFLSSIKVHGESSGAHALTEDDTPAPEDAYGRSKRDAEAVLLEMHARGELECVVVRSPLVIGAPVRGNLGTLLQLADTPWPLPFAAIENRRSFVHVEDLVDLLLACTTDDAAAGRVYLAAHREPFSTPQLIAAMRAALGRPARLFPMPPRVIERIATLLGRGLDAQRLTRSLEADPSRAEGELGWRATRTLAEGVREMAERL